MKNKICINQLGYSIYGTKRAVCTGSGLAGGSFSLVDAVSDRTMMTGKLTKPFTDEATEDVTAVADFSSFSLPGVYYIRSGRRKSFCFPISEKPYTELKNTLLKGFYYNRCGELDENYAGDYAHGKCHSGAAALISDKSKFIDVTGGWHDSGSYGKYTVPACIALGHMLYAYKLFPNSFREKDSIPGAQKGMPDILAECRYELDWLLKMQAGDGGVYHKVCTLNISDFVTPENDTAAQYVSPPSYQATALFVAVVSLAAGIYDKYDEDFADLLRSAAFSGWIWISNHPEPALFVNPPEITHTSNGDIPPSDPGEIIFWTVCELYEMTGEEMFREKIKELYRSVCVTEFTYRGTGGFGAMAYMTGTRPRDIEIERSIRLQYRIEADNLVSLSEKSGYETAMAPDDYKVFTNIHLMNSSVMLIFAYMMLKCPDYIRVAGEQFNYILGKNPMGKCFVTGEGSDPVKNPHHRMSAFGENDYPVPGLAVIGVCSDDSKKDDYAKWNIPKGTPPGKCYCDNNFCFSTNETAVCCNSSLLFTAAYFDAD